MFARMMKHSDPLSQQEVFFCYALPSHPSLLLTPWALFRYSLPSHDCFRPYRSDRISHMRDIFPNASPEDLFEALDTRGWNVTQACAVFGGGICPGGACGGLPKVDLERTCAPGDSMGGNSEQDSQFRLWFDSVAEELRGRHRVAFSPGRRQQFPGNPGQMPSWRFGR